MKWFAVWSAIGAIGALAVLGAMTIGVFVAPVAVVAAVIALRHPESFVGLPGLVTGAALPLLYVAFLNRDGPGTVCTTSPTGNSCTDEMSPWPWLAIAVALVVAGVVVFEHRRSARP